MSIDSVFSYRRDEDSAVYLPAGLLLSDELEARMGWPCVAHRFLGILLLSIRDYRQFKGSISTTT